VEGTLLDLLLLEVLLLEHLLIEPPPGLVLARGPPPGLVLARGVPAYPCADLSDGCVSQPPAYPSWDS
jgi:hypothetical protein